MKRHPRIMLQLVVALIAIVLFQVTLCGKDIGLMDLAEASEAIKEAERAAGPASRFVGAAIAAGRKDVLTICWNETTYCRHFLFQDLKELPDSRLKNEILLIILKSPRTNLLYNDTPFRSSETARRAFAGSFIPMLQKTLPAIPVNYDSVATLDKRLVLAAAMERALAKDLSAAENSKPVWSPILGRNAGAPPAPPRRVGPPPEPTATTPVAAAGNAGESLALPGGWGLLAGIAALLTAAGWLIFRGRGKGRKS